LSKVRSRLVSSTSKRLWIGLRPCQDIFEFGVFSASIEKLILIRSKSRPENQLFVGYSICQWPGQAAPVCAALSRPLAEPAPACPVQPTTGSDRLDRFS
ncbi:Unknown protein, partial [Striga hermonthica]